MKYTISTISSIVNGTITGKGDVNTVIKNLLIDSRNMSTAETSLFFAIVGERHDGHTYIRDLHEKGVRNFVVSVLPQDSGQFIDTNFILVKDTLLALQQLAAYHRGQFKIPVVGITGSNGKTIVKEWLYQLIREDKNSVRSPKSFNSQVGVPLSVWQINAEHNLGIFEAGISKPNEMRLLENIIQPTIG
ncbi:MAG: Mur ligase family protein, partial [Bacteroidota bacterium]